MCAVPRCPQSKRLPEEGKGQVQPISGKKGGGKKGEGTSLFMNHETIDSMQECVLVSNGHFPELWTLFIL